LTTISTTPRVAGKSALQHIISNNLLVLVLYGALLIAFMGISIQSPSFRSGANLWMLARQAVIPGIIGIAQTIVIISGGIDFSVASLVTFISLLGAGLMDGSLERFVPVTILMLLIGLLVGLAHGLIVTRGRVPLFITTLGTNLVLQGAALAYTTVPKGGIPALMGDLFYYSTVGPIPNPAILLAVIFLLAVLLLHNTGFGRAIYAIGGNPEVAHRSGIKVVKTQIIVYCLVSFLVSIAAIVDTARMGIGDLMAGVGMGLDSITVVVMGGTSLFGGRGNLFGTLAGVFILLLINNVMLILGVSVFYQQLIKGLVVLLVVALYKQRA